MRLSARGFIEIVSSIRNYQHVSQQKEKWRWTEISLDSNHSISIFRVLIQVLTNWPSCYPPLETKEVGLRNVFGPSLKAFRANCAYQHLYCRAANPDKQRYFHLTANCAGFIEFSGRWPIACWNYRLFQELQRTEICW